ncbi:MAG: hypothetical protein J5502_00520 [Prevotella sp.]|nr:hypothetical protein [Prevotella sp.]
MEEKKHPVFEEESGMDKCCESPVGYGATGSGYDNTIETCNDKGVAVADDWDPGIGPYSLEELNARIDEAELCIEKAEKGDWSDWVSEEQSRANLYSKYPWLR